MIIAETIKIEDGMHPECKLVFAQISATKYIVGFMFRNGMMSESKKFDDYRDAENCYKIKQCSF